jgi:hypothetical protein
MGHSTALKDDSSSLVEERIQGFFECFLRWVKMVLVATLFLISTFQVRMLNFGSVQFLYTYIAIKLFHFLSNISRKNEHRKFCHFMSNLLQSVGYVAKYLRTPTSVTMEPDELQPEDSPWITICPFPVENIKLLENFDCPNASAPCKEYGTTSSLTIDRLAELARRGISLQSYLESVGKPLYRYKMNCRSKLQQTGNTGSRSCYIDRSAPTSSNISGGIMA